jgi:HopA1 effector protein family
MTEHEYKSLVTAQINQIVENIFFDADGNLCDQSIAPPQIALSIRKFGIDVIQGLSKDDLNEFLLTNWIYANYYQNRADTPISTTQTQVNSRHFPFKDPLRNTDDSYWRNRFWQYDTQVQERERAVLTRGFETRIVSSQQFVEDELVFETFKTPDEPLIEEEVKYLCMVFPKFQIGKTEKFVFGKQPLDDDGQGGIIRIYLHLDAAQLTQSIPRILTKINRNFNERLIPFHLKFWSETSSFVRADNMVLYLERRHFFVAGLLLTSLYDDIKKYLDQDRLPYFVREAMPGIGFAKSPQKGEQSFGSTRAKALANAILKLHKNPDVKPVLKYLDDVWSGIQYFYLNPRPSFIYDFSVFDQQDIVLFRDEKEDEFLSAAWYIAKLLCREAIWVANGQCNWMSYQAIDKDRNGYCLLGVNNGFEGLEGVITFLQAFSILGIRDTVIDYVLEAAKEYFQKNAGEFRIMPVAPPVNLFTQPKRSFILPIEFKSDRFKEEVKDIITEKETPDINDYPSMRAVLKQHIMEERPLGNMLDGTDNFCANMRNGLAAYGYVFLRLYDPTRIIRLTELESGILNLFPSLNLL